MHWRAQAFADPRRGIGSELIGRQRQVERGRAPADVADGIATAPRAPAAPVAMYGKSRREGCAAEIVVTRLALFRLAGHTSVRAANRPPPPFPPPPAGGGR